MRNQRYPHQVPTHHCEVLGAALGAPVVAGQEHVLDVVARAVVELAHGERPRLVAVEVRLLLQHLQHVLFDQVGVADLVPKAEARGVRIKGLGAFSLCGLMVFLTICKSLT